MFFGEGELIFRCVTKIKRSNYIFLQWYPGGLNRSKCCRQPICTGVIYRFRFRSLNLIVDLMSYFEQNAFCNSKSLHHKRLCNAHFVMHTTTRLNTMALSPRRREKRSSRSANYLRIEPQFALTCFAQEEQKVIAAQIRIKKEEMERQEEREKELHAERKKRAEEGPPPPARAPPPQPAAERLPAADSARRQRTSQYGQPRGGQQSDQMAMSSDPRYNQSHLAASQQYPSGEECCLLHKFTRVILCLADDAYLDRDDNFQVDVEELMVMEAIRLSLLESHSRGNEIEGECRHGEI
jgi:hypothetical protein